MNNVHDKQRILIVKTSSLGDILHMFPAINDLSENIPDIEIDWVVEKDFAEVVSWNPHVKNIIPVSIRRWRKNLYRSSVWNEINKLRKHLKEKNYSHIIDAQGLLKSLWITKIPNADTWGFDRRCNREWIASLFYDHECYIAKSFFSVHAIERNRRLISYIFDYKYNPIIHYGNLKINNTAKQHLPDNYIVFIHGTSRVEKEFSESNWVELAKKVTLLGYAVILPWGNMREYNRAININGLVNGSILLPKTTLSELSLIIKSAKAIVGVDTGLLHIAGALKTPGIAIFTNTDPSLFSPVSEGDTIAQPKLIESISLTNDLGSVDAIYQKLILKLEKRL